MATLEKISADMVAGLTKANDRIAELGTANAKQQSVIDGLLKAVSGPASRVGLSPEEFLAKAVGDGKQPLAIGGDGGVTPIPGERKRSLGMAPWLAEMYECAAKKLDIETFDKRMSEKWNSKAALAESPGGTVGGYLVPPQWLAELMKFSMEDQIVRPRAKVIPMNSRTANVPTLDVSTVYATGQTPFLGGLAASWAGEAQTRAESEPQFRQTELNANELTFYTVASNTVIADAMISIESLLTQMFPEALAWHSDYAFLQGNGVQMPLGILNAPGTLAMARLVAGTISTGDIFNMESRLVGPSMKRAIWVFHQSCLPKIAQLSDQGNRPLFMPIANPGSGGPITGPMSETLRGRPIFWTEKLNVLGTKGDALLFDPGQYLVGERMGIQVEVSPHVNFLKNQMVWRIVARLDGQPWVQKPITLQDGTFTVSPYVVLN